MKRILVTISLLIFWVATGCHMGLQPRSEIENGISVRLNENPGRGISVTTDSYGESAWFETCTGRPVRPIGSVPETSARSVWQAAISPGDDYLAVLSVDEGHPMVDIFQMDRIFSEAKDSEKLPPLISIDPYPGTIRIQGWQGDTILEVESDVPLNLLDKYTGRTGIEEPWSEPRGFLWDVSTGVIEVKPSEKRPVDP